jgi:hypothetical protein
MSNREILKSVIDELTRRYESDEWEVAQIDNIVHASSYKCVYADQQFQSITIIYENKQAIQPKNNDKRVKPSITGREWVARNMKRIRESASDTESE